MAKKETDLFFVGCPKCKKKFGVQPKYVFMYLDRVFGKHAKKDRAFQDFYEKVSRCEKK
ncbi:MAG: hypothetical protein ABIC82_04920 [bacterium]